MKKLLLSLAVLTASVNAVALDGERVNLDMTPVYQEWDGKYEDTSFAMFNMTAMFRVSDNGKYAVTFDAESTHSGAMWINETNEIVFLNEKSLERNTSQVIAYDVADNGTIAGAVVDDDLMLHPAVKPLNGEWVMLPMPDEWYKKWNYKYADYASVAKLISPDGKVVCGEIYLAIHGGIMWYPIIWKLDDNNNVVETVEFTNEVLPNSFFVPMDMTDDGSIIVGKADSERGEHLPAMFKDGKFEFIAAPVLTEIGLVDEKTGMPINEHNQIIYTDEEGKKYVEDVVLDENGDPRKDENGQIIYVRNYDEVATTQVTVLRELDENGNDMSIFWDGGQATCIDDDLNVYYIYTDSKAPHSVVKNLTTGEQREFEVSVAVGSRGVIVGAGGMVLQGPDDLDLQGVIALSMADDATVFAGCGTGTANGNPYNYPALVVYETSPLEGWNPPSGVKEIMFDTNNLTVDGGVINIEGTYDVAEMFDAAGRKVAEISGSYDMNGLSAGLYIVKIQNNGTTYVHKIAK